MTQHEAERMLLLYSTFESAHKTNSHWFPQFYIVSNLNMLASWYIASLALACFAHYVVTEQKQFFSFMYFDWQTWRDSNHPIELNDELQSTVNTAQFIKCTCVKMTFSFYTLIATKLLLLPEHLSYLAYYTQYTNSISTFRIFILFIIGGVQFLKCSFTKWYINLYSSISIVSHAICDTLKLCFH